jgi:shikimate kinase
MKRDSRNIFLVGLMGAGKTTVGRVLARRLGLPFVDSDQEIEARTGVSIPTIFEIEGEEGFRQREAQVIEELTQREALVLATGGGVVLDPANRAHLKAGGWVVYIDVPPEALYERIRNDRNRPLIQVENPLARLQELYAQRAPLYREVADFIVDGRRLNTQGVLQCLLKEIEKRCKH